MKTTRRKIQTYPVALAIALLIATSARAQLCPTAATTSGVAGFTEQTDIDTSSAKTSAQNPASLSSMIAQPMQVAKDVPAQFVPALSAEASSASFLPQAAVTQNEPVASNRARDDVVHKLLLAASQPALAEASLQPMLAD
jgi:hypothetical protein